MRRIVTALAVLGVLLHSALLLRHAMTVVSNGIMAASSEIQTLEADLEVICHAAHGAETATPGNLPSKSGKCPVCAGLCSAVALAAPEFGLVTVSLPSSRLVDRPIDQRVERNKRIRPPGRGPPSLA